MDSFGLEGCHRMKFGGFHALGIFPVDDHISTPHFSNRKHVLKREVQCNLYDFSSKLCCSFLQIIQACHLWDSCGLKHRRIQPYEVFHFLIFPIHMLLTLFKRSPKMIMITFLILFSSKYNICWQN
jgi:hypothetical protein